MKTLVVLRVAADDDAGVWLAHAITAAKVAIENTLDSRVAGVSVTVDRVVERTEPWELPGCEPLSRREKQIAWLIAQGMKRAEVAEQEGLNPKTFDTHRLRVLAKLRCTNEVQLARLAIGKGWIDL